MPLLDSTISLNKQKSSQLENVRGEDNIKKLCLTRRAKGVEMQEVMSYK